MILTEPFFCPKTSNDRRTPLRSLLVAGANALLCQLNMTMLA